MQDLIPSPRRFRELQPMGRSLRVHNGPEPGRQQRSDRLNFVRPPGKVPPSGRPARGHFLSKHNEQEYQCGHPPNRLPGGPGV